MESFLIPKNIFIGDEAELAIKFSDIKIDQTIFNNSGLKNSSIETKDVSILGLSLRDIGNEKFLIVKFKAWKTGDIKFPSLKEYGIISQLPSVNVLSLLSESESTVVRENYSPVLLPGTKFLFFLCFVLSVFFSVMIFIFYQKILKKKKTKNKKRALKKLNRETKKLLKNKIKNKKIFMADFEKALRTFLLNFFYCFDDENIFALTFAEIKHILKKDSVNECIILSLDELLTLVELVRFSDSIFDEKKFLYSITNFTKSCMAECNGEIKNAQL